MNILILDIETQPNIAHIWETWNVKYVPPSALVQAKDVLCFAAKWHGAKEIAFSSVYDHGYDNMFANAWELLNEADAVVHYYGKKHDIPYINRGFLKLGMIPPSPYRQIDLHTTVKKQFQFPYNSLDYVCQELDIGSKLSHAGHELWVRCMNNEPEAWAQMQAYNMQDVVLTEKLFDRLRPWISGVPSIGAELGADVCPRCGNVNLVKEGFSYTKTGRYQRYHCSECFAWLTATRRDQGTTIKEELI